MYFMGCACKYCKQECTLTILISHKGAATQLKKTTLTRRTLPYLAEPCMKDDSLKQVILIKNLSHLARPYICNYSSEKGQQKPFSFASSIHEQLPAPQLPPSRDHMTLISVCVCVCVCVGGWVGGWGGLYVLN